MRASPWLRALLVVLSAGALSACAVPSGPPLQLSFAPLGTPGAEPRYQLPKLGGGPTGPRTPGRPDGLSLVGAWQLALDHSHNYQAAVKARQASATLRTRGLAGLLPHIQAGYSFSRISGERWQPLPTGQTFTRPLDYDSKSAYISLRQPLLDFGSYSSYQWFLAQADQGQADWRVARYELAQKMAKRWVDVLAARAQRKLDRELVDSLTQQVDAQQTLYEYGAGRVIDVQQTRSRLQTARARLIGDQARLRVARRALQALVGSLSAPLPTLADQAAVAVTLDRTLDQWQQRARQSNARIAASRAADQVAVAAVDRHVKMRWPRLQFMASWRHASSGDLATIGQRTHTYAVGLQLVVPLYAGGQRNAKIAQSRAQRRQASQEFQGTMQTVETQVTQYYQNVRSVMGRIQALQVSVAASQSGLKATNIGYEYGARSNLDVLRARNELFQSREQLMQARLNLLRSYIRLRLTAGGDLSRIFQRADRVFFAGQSE